MKYRIAQAGEPAVAGMMQAGAGQPNRWTAYFAVNDCDMTAVQAASLGATVVTPPADIPGTGRFAILSDPQGASFGILQTLPVGMGGAFAPLKTGHGNWQEFVTADPIAALAFYGKLFGWTLTRSMQMGPDMTYHIFACNGRNIGGAFAAMPPAPPWWKT